MPLGGKGIDRMNARVASLLLTLASLLVAAVPGSAAGQQSVGVSTRAPTAGNSFYESFGVGWSFQRMGPGGGFFVRGPGLAPPPFGLGDPAAGAHLGFAQVGNGSRFSLNLFAAQGSSRSNSVQAASVVVPNGGQGFISDTSVRPFVIGWIPVVGQQAISPLHERLQRLASQPGNRLANEHVAAVESSSQGRAPSTSAPQQPALRLGTSSSAERGESSVAEIHRQRQAARAAFDDEIQNLIACGEGYQQQNQLGVAIIYYQQAASRAEGQHREEIQRRVAELKQLTRNIHQRSAARP
jgi:hypothetical protein